MTTALAGCNLFEGNAAMHSSLAFHALLLDTAPMVERGREPGRTKMQAHARLVGYRAPGRSDPSA